MPPAFLCTTARRIAHSLFRSIFVPLNFRLTMFLAAAFFATTMNRAEGASSHLWWNVQGQEAATCVYGEVTVLASHEPIYYCAANWHPGEPAGGYCGLQHNSAQEKRTIFSIWDTTPQLHPIVSYADSETVHNRFGGEGEGGHTHMLWNWPLGQTFQFFVQKVPGTDEGTTDARYFVYDAQARRWRHSATITSPNGDEKCRTSVATIGGGGLCSFLENFGGNKNANIPKLAIYRLWIGSAPTQMKSLTEAQGDGLWGKFADGYYLAEGDEQALASVFERYRKQFGQPVVGTKDTKLEPIADRPLGVDLIKALVDITQASTPRAK